jgi:hypothetical protein
MDDQKRATLQTSRIRSRRAEIFYVRTVPGLATVITRLSPRRVVLPQCGCGLPVSESPPRGSWGPFSKMGFISTRGSTPDASAWTACARLISPPSRVTAAFRDIFCALKGATRHPSWAKMRHNPVTMVLFPTVEAVPCTMSVWCCHWTWWINRPALYRPTSGRFLVMRQSREAFSSRSQAPSECFCEHLHPSPREMTLHPHLALVVLATWNIRSQIALL